MSPWRTVTLVAGREVRQRVRSRAFQVITVLFATVLAVVAALPTLLAERGPTEQPVPETATIGVIGAVEASTLAGLTAGLGTSPELVAVAGEDEAAALLEDGLVAFVVADGGARLLAAGAEGPFSAPVPPGVTQAIGLARALEAGGADPGTVQDVLDAPPVPVEVIVTGTGVDPDTAGGRFAVAYAGSLVLYFVLVFFANLIVTGVIEEKGSRVVELLLPAVPARQLMGGKVIGLGTVGTLQAAAMVTPGLLVLITLGGDQLPPSLATTVVATLVAFVLGYGLYAGVTAGLSSLVSRVEDSQVALFPLYAILVAAFATSFPVLNTPDGALARVVTYVPFTAPFVVPARIALVDLPLWEAALAGLGVIVTAVLLTLLAARLYEGAILRAGARVSLAAAWRGARE